MFCGGGKIRSYGFSILESWISQLLLRSSLVRRGLSIFIRVRLPLSIYTAFPIMSSFLDWANYKDRLLLRSQQVANSPELIRRLGIIAMNTPMEVDIYGHANSTCALGSRWVILSLK